jgi:cell division protein FtsQ
MTRIDLEAIRQDLMTLSWVEDARISRQLPDTLIVDITERKPQAVLKQHNEDGSDSFVLIDATGHELQGISAGRVGGRLVLAGDGAEGRWPRSKPCWRRRPRCAVRSPRQSGSGIAAGT